MIRYTTTLEGIEADMLFGFFVGWPTPPSPVVHLQSLKNSRFLVLAVDDLTSQVVGFINAVSDGTLCAYIPLLEVLPDYQGRGIGTELVKRILEQCARLYMVDTTCDEDLQPFYARCGLKPSGGMMIRNHDRQSGNVGADH